MSYSNDFDLEGDMPSDGLDTLEQLDTPGPQPTYNPFALAGSSIGADTLSDPNMVMFHLATGAKPEDFTPGLQPLADGLSVALATRPDLGAGLLGPKGDLQNALAHDPSTQISTAASPAPQDNADGPVVEPQAPAVVSDLESDTPDVHIPSPPLPYGLKGLQEVQGLPIERGSGAVPRFDGLIADKVASVFKTLNEQGIPAQLRDGFRTREAQAKLAGNQNGGAQPGNGLHEAGLAFDLNWNRLNPSQQQAVLKVARENGFQWGGKFKKVDAVHFYVDPFNRLDARQAYIRGLQSAQGN